MKSFRLRVPKHSLLLLFPFLFSTLISKAQIHSLAVTNCTYTSETLQLNGSLCGTTCTLSTSGYETGVTYTLRNSNNTIVSTAVLTNGVQMVFSNVPISSTPITYYLYGQKSGCSLSSSMSSLSVTGLGATTGTVSSSSTSGSICANGSVTYTATPSGTGPFTYAWKNGTTVLANTGPTYTTSTPGNYTVTISGACNSTAALPCPAFIIAPNVTWPGTAVAAQTSIYQPVSGSATTVVTVPGSTNATGYSWFVTPTSAGSFPRGGSGGVKDTITWAAGFSGVATIQCTANGACGSTSTSLPATDTVYSPITVGTISSVGGASEIQSGTTINLTSSGAATNGNSKIGYSYQWQYQTTPGGSWYSLGSPSSNFSAISTVPSQALVNGPNNFRLLVTNNLINNPSYSNTLSIFGLGVGSIPFSLSATNGTVSLSSSGGTGAPSGSYSYQWYVSTTNTTLSSFSPVSGQTNLSYSPSGLTSPTYYYYLQVKNNGATAISNICTVTVGSNTACTNGGPFTLISNGTCNPVTFTLNGSSQPGVTYTLSGPGVSGSTQSGNGGSISWSNISVSSSGLFSVTASTTSPACSGTVATLSQGSPTNTGSPGAISGSSSIQLSSTATTTAYTVTAAANATSYNWTLTSGAGTIPATTTSPNNTVTWSNSFTGTSATITCTPTGPCGPGLAATPGTVTIYQPVTVGSITPSSTSINYNGSITLTSAAPGGGNSGLGYTYQWQSQTAGSTTWNNVGTNSSTYTASGLQANTSFQLIVSNNGNPSPPSNVVQVTVYPQLTVNLPATLNTTYGGTIGTILATTAGGNPGGTYSYQWQSSPTNGNFQPIPGAPNSSSYSPSALTSNIYYEVILSNNGLSVTSNPCQVTVGPAPLVAGNFTQTLYTILPNASNSPTLTCSAPSGGPGQPYSYVWYQSTDGVNFNTPISNNSLTYSLPPLTAGVYFYRIQITSGTVTTLTASVQVNVSSCLLLGTTLPKANNFIVTSTPRIPGVTNPSSPNNPVCSVNQSITYLDGLGRPIQTVVVKGSPTFNDIIQPEAYDVYGREPIKYLPYTTSAGSPGSYRSTALTGNAGNYASSDQSLFYQQTNPGYSVIPTPFSGTAFEPSPLNRVIEQGAPGNDWQLTGTPSPNGSGTIIGGHTVTIAYGTNSSTPPWANGLTFVRYFTVSINPTSGLRSLVDHGTYYPSGTLYQTVTRNENWSSSQTDPRLNTTEEFKDLEGQVLVKRTYVIQYNTTKMLSTYYVYDDFGNLSYVLPPLSSADNGVITQSILDNLCYQYNYDLCQRLIEKKLPGKGWEFIVYNVLDQAAYTQDANQRNQPNQVWTYHMYDAFGRPTITGLWGAIDLADGNMSSPNRAPEKALQSNENYNPNYFEHRDNTNLLTGYNADNPYGTILSINYYDDYNVVNLPSYKPGKYFPSTMGLPTATKVSVLNTNAPDMLWSMSYFDDFGRPTDVYAQHYLGGVANASNYDHTANTYDFTGELITGVRTQFTVAGLSTPVVTINNTYSYDQEGRKTQTMEQINSDKPVILSQTTYNELGQLYTKQLHSENSGVNFLKTIQYQYNERGWLNNISTPDNQGPNLDFSETLKYNSPDKGYTPQFNGNISEMSYTILHNNGAVTNFRYIYDNLNRLDSAITLDHSLDEVAVYDIQGNITSLQRTAKYGNPPVGNGFTYTYRNGGMSNQDSIITNWQGNLVRNYTYDLNGNTLTDTAGRSIVYNLLNLPQSVSFIGQPSGATYTYNAAGVKLRASGVAGNYDYANGIVYKNGTIVFIPTEEGRAEPNAGTYNYTYDIKDHLGNVRVTFGKDISLPTSTIIQEDQFYAFGFRVPGGSTINPSNPYLYNGKEIQYDLKNFYDYGARFYDPLVARWTTIDPKAENDRRYSPYTYGLDNSIRFEDPDGMEAEEANSGPGPGPNLGKPMYYLAEGFRQLFQAGGALIDNAYASISTATDRIISQVSGSNGSGSYTVTTSANVTNTTTVRTNFGGVLSMNSHNTPEGPFIKVTNSTDVSQQTKVEGTTTIRGVDIKASNTTNISNTKVSNTTEFSTGKSISSSSGKTSVGGALFVSVKNSSGSSGTSSQTDVGLKASVSYTPTPNISNIMYSPVANVKASITFKLGVTVDKH